MNETNKLDLINISSSELSTMNNHPSGVIIYYQTSVTSYITINGSTFDGGN